MAQAFEQLQAIDLEDRVLSFDAEAAAQAALLAAVPQIAGIAQARRATLATRNLRHFEGLTVAVVDPWA